MHSCCKRRLNRAIVNASETTVAWVNSWVSHESAVVALHCGCVSENCHVHRGSLPSLGCMRPHPADRVTINMLYECSICNTDIGKIYSHILALYALVTIGKIMMKYIFSCVHHTCIKSNDKHKMECQTYSSLTTTDKADFR